MLGNMKNKLINVALLTLLSAYTYTAYSALYKGLDSEGNVVYSDRPFDQAEAITPPAISVVNATKVPVKADIVEEEKETTETVYTKFSIKSPKNDETIWNAPQLTVSLQLQPDLDTVNGHNLWLLLDGKALVKKSSSLNLQISRADRGEHKVQAEVRNSKGKIIKRTKAITVHIKNTVVPRKSPR